MVRFCSVFFPNWEVWKIVNFLMRKIHWNDVISCNFDLFLPLNPFPCPDNTRFDIVLWFSVKLGVCSHPLVNIPKMQKIINMSKNPKLVKFYIYCISIVLWFEFLCFWHHVVKKNGWGLLWSELLRFIDKSYMLPVAVHLNNITVGRHVQGIWHNKESSPYRGDSLVHIWISEVLQVLTY